MKALGKVTGSMEQAQPIVIGKDIVYVHTDIIPATDKEGNVIEGLFTYNETQYSKDEYIKAVTEKLNSDITDTQLALCEIYETFGGAQ